MIAAADSAPQGAGLGPVITALRARLALVVLLFVLAALAWWLTVDRMEGMDAGPGTDLGTLGWFVGVWVVMMAAMMFPSVAPTVALYSQMTRRREPFGPLAFASGYLLTWAGVGVLAYGVYALGSELLGDQLAWDSAGQWLAGGTLALAAVYEVTPLKDACLGRCRTPLGFLLGNWRDGRAGAVEMGAKHGAWCVGCCWALMAALFALGVMSIAWMAFVGGIIALEKLLPWGRVATYATAALLLALAILLIASPDSIPGLTVPGGDDSMMAPSMSM
jgi:predicted metal-binding membrane protein